VFIESMSGTQPHLELFMSHGCLVSQGAEESLTTEEVAPESRA
jgi:hypothetical protein